MLAGTGRIVRDRRTTQEWRVPATTGARAGKTWLCRCVYVGVWRERSRCRESFRSRAGSCRSFVRGGEKRGGKKRIRVMGHKFESRVVKVLCRTTTVQENFLDIYAFYPLSLSRCCASVRCCRSRRRHLLFSFTDASDIYFTHDPIDGKGAAVKIVESVMMIGL